MPQVAGGSCGSCRKGVPLRQPSTCRSLPYGTLGAARQPSVCRHNMRGTRVRRVCGGAGPSARSTTATPVLPDGRLGGTCTVCKACARHGIRHESCCRIVHHAAHIRHGSHSYGNQHNMRGTVDGKKSVAKFTQEAVNKSCVVKCAQDVNKAYNEFQSVDTNQSRMFIVQVHY